jgi:hypothetical protein
MPIPERLISAMQRSSQELWVRTPAQSVRRGAHHRECRTLPQLGILRAGFNHPFIGASS